MTNSEKLTSKSWNSHAITEHKLKKGIGAKTGLFAEHGTGVTFADSLYSFTAQTVEVMAPTGDVENDIIQKIEDMEDDGNTASVKDLKGKDLIRFCRDEYLQNTIGADPQDPKDRELHKLTKEEKEWLDARHDFEKLQTGGDKTAFGNFLYDLVYLNVLTKSDALELMSPMLPLDDAHPARIVYLGDQEDPLPIDDGSILGLIAKHIEEQKRELEYLKDEYFYTHHTEADLEYLKKLNDYLNNKKECYEVVWQVFDEMRSGEKASMYEQRVQDVTEQLKADFGSMLT